MYVVKDLVPVSWKFVDKYIHVNHICSPMVPSKASLQEHPVFSALSHVKQELIEKNATGSCRLF